MEQARGAADERPTRPGAAAAQEQPQPAPSGPAHPPAGMSEQQEALLPLQLTLSGAQRMPDAAPAGTFPAQGGRPEGGRQPGGVHPEDVQADGVLAESEAQVTSTQPSHQVACAMPAAGTQPTQPPGPQTLPHRQQHAASDSSPGVSGGSMQHAHDASGSEPESDSDDAAVHACKRRKCATHGADGADADAGEAQRDGVAALLAAPSCTEGHQHGDAPVATEPPATAAPEPSGSASQQAAERVAAPPAPAETVAVAPVVAVPPAPAETVAVASAVEVPPAVAVPPAEAVAAVAPAVGAGTSGAGASTGSEPESGASRMPRSRAVSDRSKLQQTAADRSRGRGGEVAGAGGIGPRRGRPPTARSAAPLVIPDINDADLEAVPWDQLLKEVRNCLHCMHRCTRRSVRDLPHLMKLEMCRQGKARCTRVLACGTTLHAEQVSSGSVC